MEFDRLESHGRASEAERRHRDGSRGVHPAILRASRRAWLRIGLAALVLVGPLVVWSAVTSNPGRVPEARPLERVVVDGTAVDLHWRGEGCEHVDGERTTVTEARGEVLVVLWVDVLSDDCTGDEVARVHRISLAESLGDRDLIDGACLKPENRQHPECEVEGADGGRNPCRLCFLVPDASRTDASATPGRGD